LEEMTGTTQVRVNKQDVHKAVRNILANEMNLDVDKVKADVQAKAEEIIKKQVLEYLEGHGYGYAGLSERVHRRLQAFEDDIVRLIKEAVTQQVAKTLNEEIETVIAGYIEKGLEVQVGYRKKAKVQLKESTDG
jgi:hypothetical protein